MSKKYFIEEIEKINEFGEVTKNYCYIFYYLEVGIFKKSKVKIYVEHYDGYSNKKTKFPHKNIAKQAIIKYLSKGIKLDTEIITKIYEI